jgi:hypothetical protein
MMATDHIIALLIIERDKLNEAIEALQGTSTSSLELDSGPPAPVKRKLSAEGRRAIIAATKKRWAAVKAAKAAAAAPVPVALATAKPKTSPVKAAAVHKKGRRR